MKTQQTFKWVVPDGGGPIVGKVSGPGAPLQVLAPAVRKKARPGEPIRFDISVRAEPTSLQGKRAVILSPGPGWSNFEVRCDEGAMLGGQDSAPSPLGYFRAGIAFCMMTHVTEYVARTQLDIDHLAIELRGHFAKTVAHARAADGPVDGCEAVEVHVLIDSREPAEKIAGLMKACEAACMALQAVAQAVPTSAAVVLNGIPLDR